MANYSDMDIFNMIGTTYGKLTVKRRSAKVYPRYGVHLICECSCGGTKEVAAIHLRNKIVQSCGCLLIDPNKESMKKAVKAISKNRIYNGLYNSWSNMKKRCTNPNTASYKSYGGRGIGYDKSWEQFDAFKEDMEASWFPGADIDRIDNDGNYCVSNCQWLEHTDHMHKTWLDRKSQRAKG